MYFIYGYIYLMVIIMKKDKPNKLTLVIDRRNWAQKVMYHFIELEKAANRKRESHQDVRF